VTSLEELRDLLDSPRLRDHHRPHRETAVAAALAT
jgi:hypothetical protein